MTTQNRSQLTLAAIVDTALSMAASDGLESLTIGEVAKRLGLSKSGVFSRVGSREQLQALVLEEYDRRFVQDVMVPALREPRGLPRLNALMQRWLERAQRVEVPQGCIYCAGAFEYDDRVGTVRELLLDGVRRWRAALKRTVVQAIDEGHLAADTDAEQLAFEMDALFTGAMRDARFLGDARALQRAAHTWQRLVTGRMSPTTPARRRA